MPEFVGLSSSYSFVKHNAKQPQSYVTMPPGEAMIQSKKESLGDAAIASYKISSGAGAEGGMVKTDWNYRVANRKGKNLNVE